MADKKSTPQERDSLPADEVARLIQAVKRQDEVDNDGWSPTPARRELESLANRLEEMAKELAGSMRFALLVQPVHERPYIGADGWPIEGKPRSVLQIRSDLWELAESTRAAIDELPEPRAKKALRLAVHGYLHISHDAGRPRPTSYVDGPGVQEIAQIEWPDDKRPES